MIDFNSMKLAPRELETSREQLVVNFQQDLLLRAWIHGRAADQTVEVVETHFRNVPRAVSVQ